MCALAMELDAASVEGGIVLVTKASSVGVDGALVGVQCAENVSGVEVQVSLAWD